MVQPVATSDNEWERVTTNEEEWQRMRKSDNEWERVTTNDIEWQWVKASGATNESSTVHGWMIPILSMTKTDTLLQGMDDYN